MKIDITESQANEFDLPDAIEFELDGHKYTFIDELGGVEEHRWADTNWYIYKRDDDKLFAHPYDIGSTENQENGYVYSNCELFEVIAKTVTKTDYEVVK